MNAEYDIISEFTDHDGGAKHFVLKVNAAIADGWEPIGAPFPLVTQKTTGQERRLFQAIVRHPAYHPLGTAETGSGADAPDPTNNAAPAIEPAMGTTKAAAVATDSKLTNTESPTPIAPVPASPSPIASSVQAAAQAAAQTVGKAKKG